MDNHIKKVQRGEAEYEQVMTEVLPNNKSFFCMLQLILEFQKDNYVKNKKLIR